MNLTIGGTPASAQQLENLRQAMGVPAKADLIDNLGLGDKAPVFVKEGFLVDKDGTLIGAIGIPATEQAGIAIVEINGTPYALLPVDENGDIVANLSHRRGLLADLLDLSGEPGEISIPTDADGLVIHTGVYGQAKRFYSPVSAGTAGENSLAQGLNSTTHTRAKRSMAVGAYSRTNVIGEFAVGLGLANYGLHDILYAARTTDATMAFATATGVAGDTTSGSTTSMLPAGLYDVEVTVLAREIGTTNFARFVRQATLLIEAQGGAATLSNTTTPTADDNSNLTGLSILLGGMGGVPIYVGVTGVAGKTIQWGAFIHLKCMGVTV